MKLPKDILVLAIKRLLFFSLPIVVSLYILYEVILGYDMSFSWSSVILYGVLIGIATITNYTGKTKEENIENENWMAEIKEQKRWKIIEEDKNELILKPRFDFPYNLLSKETVKVKYTEDTATVEGPRYYVEQMTKDIQGRSNKWLRRFAAAGAFFFAFFILSVPIIFESGVYWDLRIRYHNHQMRNIQQIEVINAEELGNTVDNTNNYGNGVETKEHIVYVENHMNLVKTDKDFQLKEYLIQKDGGYGVSRLNVSGDWVFYSSGEPYSRMKLDGTENQTIYKLGYVMEPHLMGEWIYFINFEDNHNIYRMDVNGQNLERFIQKGVSDLAIYDKRLFYSYMDGESGFVESVNMDGSERKLEFETDSQVSSLSRWKDYWYYINGDYRLIRTEGKDPEVYQVPVDDNVSAYIITEEGIFYSLHGEDVGYPGDGIYKMDHFGLDKTLLSDSRFVEGFFHAGDWLLFHSSDDLQPPTLKRVDLDSNSIEIIE
ncbi:DUF5050 domain-containing protein [Gudongella sp. DL1XJH-153]|uniref:DUF5050 domain-containing protein n=1 Tax=Gudongella sp. DL1XJH-153 TaxID=3409804 RepID=UPI003BB50937